MPFDLHRNLAFSTVAVAPSPALSGTTLDILPADVALFAGPPFNCTIAPTGVQQPSSTNAEIVRVTGIVGTTLTIVRAQEGTTAIAIAVGDQIAMTVTAKAVQDIESAIDDETSNRISADSLLVSAVDAVSNALSVETTARVVAIDAVSNLVSVETVNRISVDNALAAAVLAVSNALSNEASVRVAGDLAANAHADLVSARAVSISAEVVALALANDASVSGVIIADVASHLTSTSAVIKADIASVSAAIRADEASHIASTSATIKADIASVSAVIMADVASHIASTSAVIKADLNSVSAAIMADTASHLASALSGITGGAGSVTSTELSAAVNASTALSSPALSNAISNDASLSAVIKADINSVSGAIMADVASHLTSTSAVIKADIGSVSAVIMADVASHLTSTSALIKTDIASVSAAIMADVASHLTSTSALIKTDIASVSAAIKADINSVSAAIMTDAASHLASASAAIMADVASHLASTSALIKTDIASVSAAIKTDTTSAINVLSNLASNWVSAAFNASTALSSPAISNAASANTALSATLKADAVSADAALSTVIKTDIASVSAAIRADEASHIASTSAAIKTDMASVSAVIIADVASHLASALNAISARSVGNVSTHGLQSVVNALSNRISAVTGGTGSVTSTELSAVSAQAKSAIDVVSVATSTALSVAADASQTFVLTDYFTYASGNNQPHTLLYLNGYIYMGLLTSVGKVLKIDATNLAVVSVLTLSADGEHGGVSKLIYSTTKSKIYGVCKNTGRIVVVEIDPTAFTASDVINDVGFICNGGSMATDEIYLYIITSQTPAKIVKYALSDWSTAASNTLDKNSGHALDYDGTNLYGTHLTSPGAITKITPGDLSFTAVAFQSGDNIATDDFGMTTDYVWVGLENASGTILKIAKSDLSISRISTGIAADCFAVVYDGTWIWTAFDASPGYIARINPADSTVKTYSLTINSPNELLFNGNALYVATFTSPATLNRFDKLGSVGFRLPDLSVLSFMVSAAFNASTATSSPAISNAASANTALSATIMADVASHLASTSVVLKADLTSVSATIMADVASHLTSTSALIKADIASVSTAIKADITSVSAVIKADIASVSAAISVLIGTQFHVVTVGQNLNAATQTKITGLSVSLIASGYYEVHGQIVWSQSSPTSASAIFVFGMSASAQPVMANFRCQGNQGIVSASTTLSVANILTQFTGASAISAATTSAMYAVRVSAVSNAAVAGIMFFDGQLQCSTAQSQLKCWFNCSSGNFGVTIQPGSWIRAYKIG